MKAIETFDTFDEFLAWLIRTDVLWKKLDDSDSFFDTYIDEFKADNMDNFYISELSPVFADKTTLSCTLKPEHAPALEYQVEGPSPKATFALLAFTVAQDLSIKNIDPETFDVIIIQ